MLLKYFVVHNVYNDFEIWYVFYTYIIGHFIPIHHTSPVATILFGILIAWYSTFQFNY